MWSLIKETVFIFHVIVWGNNKWVFFTRTVPKMDSTPQISKKWQKMQQIWIEMFNKRIQVHKQKK